MATVRSLTRQYRRPETTAAEHDAAKAAGLRSVARGGEMPARGRLRRAIRISAIRWGWRIRVGRIRMGRIIDAWLEICAGFRSFEADSDQLGPILAPSPHTGA